MKRIDVKAATVLIIAVLLIFTSKMSCFIGECTSDINNTFTGTLTGPLQEADLIIELKDVRLGEKFIGGLKEKMGTPLKVDEILDDSSHDKTYFYNNYIITVTLYDSEKISIITIIGNGIKTNRGLMVGDDETQVIAKYGSCKQIDEYEDEITYIYSVYTKSGNKNYNHKIFITLSAKTKKVIDISFT